MFFSGRVNERKINYGAGRQRVVGSKDELLQQSRAEREKRQLEQRRLQAAEVIQRQYRRYRVNQSAKQRLIHQYEAGVNTTATPISTQQLVTLIRHFNYIYRHSSKPSATILQHARPLLKLLTQSLRQSQPTHNYQALLLDSRQQALLWTAQVKALLHILLRLLADLSVQSVADLSSLATTILLLLDPQQSALLKAALVNSTTLPQVTQQIHSSQCSAIQSTLSTLHSTIGQRLHALTPLSTATSISTTANAANKLPIIALWAVALRPLIADAADYQSEHRQEFASTFVRHLLTVPLLKARLQSAGLQQLLASLIQPQVYDLLADAICRQAATLTTIQSPSHSYFDSKLINQRDQVRQTEWKLEDDDDAINGKPQRPRPSTRPNANVPVITWLLGNFLQLIHFSSQQPTPSPSTPAHDQLLIQCLRKLIEAVPADGLPTAEVTIHPLLLEQLNVLKQPLILNRLMNVLNHPSSHNANDMQASGNSNQWTAVSDIAVLLDTILYKWQSASADILSSLVFHSKVVQLLWHALDSSGCVESVLDTPNLNMQPGLSTHPLMSVVPFFCSCYSHQLVVTHDVDFFDHRLPLPPAAVTRCVQFLKYLLYRAYWIDSNNIDMPAQRLRERGSKLLRSLRDRQARRQFTDTETWILPPHLLAAEQLTAEIQADAANKSNRAWQLLRDIPFVLPFNSRVKLFYAFIERDRSEWKAATYGQHSGFFEHGMGIRIKVRRNVLLEDGFDQLGKLGQHLKGRIQIEFIDQFGAPEAGIDGGGVWKEFLNSLMKIAFSPSYGLFHETVDHYLYPNPNMLKPSEDLALYKFLGSCLAKAVYDRITIEPQFALFFLRLVLGQNNYVDDLSSYDPTLYRSMLSIKNYPGDVSELGLTFSTDIDNYGAVKTIPLIPNGENINVTNDNKLLFIYQLASYKLNRTIRRQTEAFLSGMREVLDMSWLQMFTADELRQLICGSTQIDLQNLRDNTQYSGGYSGNHEEISWLWEVLTGLTSEQQASFLRFATSCSRAPLLGFGALTPQFCVQRVEAGPDEQSLPTASTCMNLLRLPRYMSKQRLKQKLIFAIENASTGFGLT